MECGTPSTQNNRQFQGSIEDVFIQDELIVEDVLYGFMFHLRAFVFYINSVLYFFLIFLYIIHIFYIYNNLHELEHMQLYKAH